MYKRCLEYHFSSKVRAYRTLASDAAIAPYKMASVQNAKIVLCL